MSEPTPKAHRPVRQLSVDVARKIAAGEVIDRPAAIVRELLDNAVDSGANSITVEINGGGIDKIRIADNGYGMTKEDLQNCARPHCTSKITDSQDLMNLTTLGFRGEALASIAAVSRLSISSGTNRMKASITEDHIIETIQPVQNGRGTIVQSEGLFENFPARRVFLKRPASETMMCREVFVEKSLPRTDISFRLMVDGSIRHDLPANVTLAERFVRALELKESSQLFSELKAEGTEADGKSKWSFKLVIGEPSVYRSDRKNIFIYVNGRRVQEYSLLQAIEYGCQGFFPNGVHPVASLFLQIDSKLVDFNIHPAKKEVRFKDISSVHHGVSSTVRTYFKSYSIKASNEILEEENDTNKVSEKPGMQSFDFVNETQNQSSSSPSISSLAAMAFGGISGAGISGTGISGTETRVGGISGTGISGVDKDSSETPARSYNTSHSSRIGDFSFGGISKSYTEKVAQPEPFQAPVENHEPAIPNSNSQSSFPSTFSYFGTIFGTFLLALYNETFYIIDQHAAHERINFNKIMAGGSERQQLLVPYEITTESNSEDKYLESIKTVLETSGFSAENKGNGKWEISSIPARFTLSQQELQEALLNERKSPEEIIYHIAATTACKMSVKDGTILGPEAAAKLAWEALQLKDPHCPHGRPVWTTMTREELFARVRRT
ncbi:MAG: DNA mismatch repair endonuclease MutL [Treponema sp.]|nr:DNA mismatch repair endonuclease MutL [Candidatus Treponema equifaecale]